MRSLRARYAVLHSSEVRCRGSPGHTWLPSGGTSLPPVQIWWGWIFTCKGNGLPLILFECVMRSGVERPPPTRRPRQLSGQEKSFPPWVGSISWADMAAGDFYCRGAQAKEGVKDSQERGSSHQRRDQRAYLPPDRRRWFPAWSVRHSRRPAHRRRAEPRPRGDSSQRGASGLQGHGLSQVQV